jgi:hypothetical protein
VPAPPGAIALIGQSQADVEALFGPPASRADQGAGQSWRYASGPCSVTLFFFLDVSRNAFYALDQKIAGTDGSDAANQQCLRRLASAKPHG